MFGSIWVIHADGSDLHQIHISGLDCGASRTDPNGAGCHGVRWSPDGKKIIFAAGAAATGVNIYTANADGTGLTHVSFGGSDERTRASRRHQLGATGMNNFVVLRTRMDNAH